jgi:hypothetical protein
MIPKSNSIFDPIYVNMIKSNQKIGVIASDDSAFVNIYHILTTILRRNVIILQSDNYYQAISDMLRNICTIYRDINHLRENWEDHDYKNSTLIVDHYSLSLEERHELESEFENVIYSDHDIPDDCDMPDSNLKIIFWGPDIIASDDEDLKLRIYKRYLSTIFTFEHFSNMINTAKHDDDLFVVKENLFETCKIELQATYPGINYDQWSPEIIVYIINIVQDGKSVFYKKSGWFDSVLQVKNNYLTKCIYLRWHFSYFIQQLDLATFSKDILITICQFMFLLFANGTRLS